jgi:hypothetical protein
MSRVSAPAYGTEGELERFATPNCLKLSTELFAAISIGVRSC